MKDSAAETQAKADMEFLLARPEFRRFGWFAIQSSGFFDQTGSGKSERDLAYAEGRRDLMLELLDHIETGQPAAHPDNIPILTTIQILIEEAQQAPTENKNGRRDRYDRHDEPDGDDEP